MTLRLAAITLALLPIQPTVRAQYDEWSYAGSLRILTTPEGADLPGDGAIENFPLLVQLDSEWFDFAQTQPKGEDVRFSSGGKPLAYQIDTWDGPNGKASLWVRIPVIKGNAQQEFRIHWGRGDALSESNAKAVFNADNGYASVWHLGDPVVDDAGGTDSKDEQIKDTHLNHLRNLL